MVLSRNISKELLSRAKLLPAKFHFKNQQIGNIFEDIFSNIKTDSESEQIINLQINLNGDINNNYDLLNIFEKSNQILNENFNKEEKLNEIALESDKTNNENNNNINQYANLFEINNYSNQENKDKDNYSKDTQNNFRSFNEYQLPSANNGFENKNKNDKIIDLNDENFDLDFLKSSLSNKNQGNPDKIEIINENKNKNLIIQNNRIDDKIISKNESHIEKTSGAEDYLKDFLQIYHNNPTINSNHLDNKINVKSNEKEVCRKTDNPFEITNYTNNETYSERNHASFSYLNFNLDNDNENHNLLNNYPIHNYDAIAINGIPGLAEQIIPGINKNNFENNSINNIGDINDIFALSEAMEKKKNNKDFNDHILEPSEYRKSLENNNVNNNKKKIEKLFYTDLITKKFNLICNQDKYDGELIEIFINVINFILFLSIVTILNSLIAFIC